MSGVNQYTAGWTNDEVEELGRFVVEGLSNAEIAKLLKRSARSVAVKKSRLGLRNEYEHEKFNNREWLFQKYVTEGYSTTDIAKMAGVHFATIAKWLKKHRISARGFYEKSPRHRKKIAVKLKINQMENHPKWKGGKTRTNEGYVYERVRNHPHSNANNSVLEHRLVMEGFLGRYLTQDEVVHHLNEIKDDNRIGNLFVFATGRDHKHFHEQRNKNPEFPMLYKYDYLHKEII